MVDEKGERVGVFLEMDIYREILEELEELDELRAFDEAMASGEESIPLTAAEKLGEK